MCYKKVFFLLVIQLSFFHFSFCQDIPSERAKELDTLTRELFNILFHNCKERNRWLQFSDKDSVQHFHYKTDLPKNDDAKKMLEKMFFHEMIDGMLRPIYRKHTFQFCDIDDFEINRCIGDDCWYIKLFSNENLIYLEEVGPTKKMAESVLITFSPDKDPDVVYQLMEKIISLCKN